MHVAQLSFRRQQNGHKICITIIVITLLLRPTPRPPRVALNSCRRSYPQRWPLPKRIRPGMGTVGFYGSLAHDPRLKFPISRTIVIRAASSPPQQVEFSRRQVLERVDEELAKGNERAALALVKDSQGKPGGLRCFGSARQVPQRLYTLDELKLNGIETASLLSPVDATLGAIERNLQLAAVAGGLSAWNLLGLSPQQIFYISLGLLFLWTFDSVSFNGGVGSLVLDTIGHTFSQKYRNRVLQHEAGHFLIAYLVGILPRGYTISNLDALEKEGSLNVQAGTSFVDFEFLEEVNAGKVLATTLNKFACIALAGVATEYLLFGCAEGGLADINKLDQLLNGLGFTQKKADSQVRWSVLNTVLLLRRHEAARGKLAEAMSEGKSIGSCIDVIEDTIGDADI